jgi:hypothetical protein
VPWDRACPVESWHVTSDETAIDRGAPHYSRRDGEGALEVDIVGALWCHTVTEPGSGNEAEDPSP